MSKYGVISGPYFPVFSPNTGKPGPEITPYLDTFHAVYILHFYEVIGTHFTMHQYNCEGLFANRLLMMREPLTVPIACCTKPLSKVILSN